MDLLTLIYLRPLLRMRRQMRQNHHLELIQMMQANAADFGRLMPKWWFELGVLASASMSPQQFPVHVLADDFVVKQVKRIRNGIVMHLFATAGIIVLGSMS